MPQSTEEMSQQDIDLDIERGMPLLRGISAIFAVQRIMLGRGYTPQDHKDGWTMLLRLMGYKHGDLLSTPVDPAAAQQAITKLDLWDGPNFALATAALDHLHPDQAEYVFKGLSQQTGAAAISPGLLRQGCRPARWYRRGPCQQPRGRRGRGGDP